QILAARARQQRELAAAVEIEQAADDPRVELGARAALDLRDGVRRRERAQVLSRQRARRLDDALVARPDLAEVVDERRVLELLDGVLGQLERAREPDA